MNYHEVLDQLNTLTAQVKDLMENEEVFEEDGCVDSIHHPESSVFILKANAGYSAGVDTLCKLTDTENGYIAYFPSYSANIQENYICMDYSEADCLRKLLNHIHRISK